MKPIEFTEHNTVIAKNQPPYFPMPAHNDECGRLIFCWSLSWKERVKVLFTGKVWHSVLSFNKPLQPQKLEVESPFKKQ